MPQRRSSKRQNSARADYPGWLYGLFGLAIGLSVAAAVWFSDRRAAPVPAAPEPASMERAPDRGDSAAPPEAPVVQEPKKSRFDFYEMLPSFEVEVTEEEADVAPGSPAPQAVVEPGVYMLQAGSFSRYADADRRRAELALQGIESSIQKVTIDNKTFHRVRIGPIENLDELNVVRSRLRAAKIDVLRIRLGD